MLFPKNVLVKDKIHIKRMTVAFLIIAAILFVLIARLFVLQVLNSDYYKNLVINQITYVTEVNPERGEILDSNGKVLATNVSEYQVIISPEDMKKVMESNPAEVYAFSYTDENGTKKTKNVPLDEFIALSLSEMFDFSYDQIKEKMNKEGRYYETIGSRLSEDQAKLFRAFCDEYSCSYYLYLETYSKRYYPYGDLGSHVLGFLNSEGVGIYGLENYYNNLLEGSSGRYVTAKDGHLSDMPFDYESYVDAKNGYSIQTTIDVTLQNALEAQLKEVYNDSKAGQHVTGVVMNVENGAILAMATYPNFDCNSPYTLDEKSIDTLSAYTEGTAEYTETRLHLLYTLWKNKAVTDTYIPGSTFKIITSAMALEEGVVTTDTIFNCSGGKVVVEGTEPVHCFRTTGHGTISFATGLQQSCNVVFMDVAEILGAKKFYSYMNSFGYMSKTGIDLPAESGSIILSENSFQVDPLSQQIYSFGQNFNTTIIQQITAVCAVANGGNLVTPHLLSAIVDSDGNVVEKIETEIKRQVISEETCTTVSEMLMEGVAGSGGAKNAYVAGYNVAAKTGTSEKKDTTESLRVGSCVAYAPAEDPQIAVMIVVDEPNADSVYGSVVAAPYVASFLSEALPYLGVQAKESDQSALVSNYVGLNIQSAINALSYEGIHYEVVGSGEQITAQMPQNGSKIDKTNGILILYTGDTQPVESITIPSVINQKYDSVIQKLTSLGLNVVVEGSTDGNPTVISQSLTTGTRVSRGTMITIEVRHLDILDD